MLEYYRKSLLDLFKRIQTIAADPWEAAEECYGVQQILIRRTLYVERKLQQIRTEMDSLKRELRQRPTKDCARELKDEIKYLRWLIGEYRFTRLVFKSVGDALAYIYVPIWDMKPMGVKESPGFMVGKAGLLAERLFLRKLARGGFVAILNDLTNDLRYGDITVVFGPGSYGLVEVKSGTQEWRAHPQQETKLQKVADYLTTDVADDLFDVPGRVVRTTTHAQEVWHAEALNEAIRQARERGSAIVVVEEGVIYHAAHSACGDFETVKTDLETVTALMGKPTFAVLNTQKCENFGHVPFCLSISDPQAAFDFYAGNLVIMVIIDMQKLIDKFAALGIAATPGMTPDKENVLRLVDMQSETSDWATVFVGPHIIDRLFLDFLSLDWFVNEHTHRLRHPPIDLLERDDEEPKQETYIANVLQQFKDQV